MTRELHRWIPERAEEQLRRAFAGDVFLAEASHAAKQVTEEVAHLLRQTYGENLQDPATANMPDFWGRMVALRRYIKLSPRFAAHAVNLARSLGLDPNRTVFAPFRLRAILHRGHELPINASGYVVHRDTWYAHPASAVVAWVPLFDVTEEETFFFYPDFFTKPVFPNDSEGFEYASEASIALDRKVAAEAARANELAKSPEEATGLDLGQRLSFDAKAAETLVFSCAQLHATQRSASGRTRFSIDCRFVNLDQYERGLGAPNVDNRSVGTALVDYLPCSVVA
ncbi:MAG: hypothetical protein HY791_31415 [Deltaproteobacteria bacterium]|nr:hypothetical protein [Deltaproteobacteria bacterium]